MSNKITRREFISKAAAGATGLALASSGLLSPSRILGANDRLSIGIIGYGQRCRSLASDLFNVSKECNAEITAVCDIWTVNLERGAAKVKELWGTEPRKFRHIEDILALDDLDGVIIATADFQHAKMLVQAIKAGKDVYCEKPMANDMKDARNVLKAYRESKCIVQIGTQRRSEGVYAAAARFIQGGGLGTLSKVDVSWNYFGARWRRDDVNEVRKEDTDWKRFLMGKKYRPWDPHQYMEWRLFRDFSSGIPDQWLSHMIDVVHWMTGESYPTSVVAHGGVYVWKDGRENADTFQALLEYPKGFLVSYSTMFGNSSPDSFKFYGTNGTLDCRTWTVTGEGGGGEKKWKEEIKIKKEPNENHMKNWLDCMRTRKTPNASVEAGYSHSVASIMAARALWTGRKIVYDPKEMEIHAV
ncbi:MAG: Gfo/Idh/MocA family oxidoreductase [Armatimonadota bacterium]|nr:Gfo/Idh/MocA family oxidoreductase [Armatimonadota bacterium]